MATDPLPVVPKCKYNETLVGLECVVCKNPRVISKEKECKLPDTGVCSGLGQNYSEEKKTCVSCMLPQTWDAATGTCAVPKVFDLNILGYVVGAVFGALFLIFIARKAWQTFTKSGRARVAELKDLQEAQVASRKKASGILGQASSWLEGTGAPSSASKPTAEVDRDPPSYFKQAVTNVTEAAPKNRLLLPFFYLLVAVGAVGAVALSPVLVPLLLLYGIFYVASKPFEDNEDNRKWRVAKKLDLFNKALERYKDKDKAEVERVFSKLKKVLKEEKIVIDEDVMRAHAVSYGRAIAKLREAALRREYNILSAEGEQVGWKADLSAKQMKLAFSVEARNVFRKFSTLPRITAELFQDAEKFEGYDIFNEAPSKITTELMEDIKKFKKEITPKEKLTDAEYDKLRQTV